MLYHAMNRKADSDAALARYTKTHSDDDPVGNGDIHAYRGEADAAFAWLERAYNQKAAALANLVSDPGTTRFCAR